MKISVECVVIFIIVSLLSLIGGGCYYAYTTEIGSLKECPKTFERGTLVKFKPTNEKVRVYKETMSHCYVNVIFLDRTKIIIHENELEKYND